MNLETLREVWRPSDAYDGGAARALWNRRAEHFDQKELPTPETSAFLRLIADRVPLTDRTTALDVGCGAGVYTLALASRVQAAVGCDVADRMIELAGRRARELAAENASFFCADWETADIDQLGLRGRFDIAFAHMTPAVNSFRTVDKLVACARRHCFLKKPTRRHDLLLDRTMELLGLRKKGEDADASMEYLFCYLWNRGFEPQFHYGHEVWSEEKTLEDALDWSVGCASLQRAVTEAERRELRRFLETEAVGGVVRERVTTTTVTVDWAVE